jgi:hypothetical protein
MALTKITGDNIQPGSITTVALAEGAGGGPKISNVSIANSSYTILDDTAIALEGGYLVITGTGFASGCQVVINSNNATSVTFVDSNTIRAQVGAADAGTKTVYVVNTDGGTAIRVNGLTYSASPTWVTGSTLPEDGVDEAISIQLDASLATSYQLQTGSSLPAGLSLAANGLLTGTVTGIGADTTYNFIVEAIDAENQESPRSFSITITAGDEYFYATTLLLNGDGTNGTNNNTFVDSSNNNFAITRNGNVAQGTFSPFSAPDGSWSNYFDGSGDYLSFGDNLDIVANDFTFECFVYFSSINNTYNAIFSKYGASFSYQLLWDAPNNRWFWNVNNGASTTVTFSDTIHANQWYHLCLERTGTSYKLYRDGNQIGTTQTISGNIADGTRPFALGTTFDGNNNSLFPLNGYVSNFRAVIGSNVYGSAPSIPTSPLTAITNTSLLTCQSNRFKDNSTNNFAITRTGDVKVTSFSPFNPTGSYSAATNGGSGYFDGNADWLQLNNNSAFLFGAGDFTLECWVYRTSTSGEQFLVGIWDDNSTVPQAWNFRINGSGYTGFFIDVATADTTIFVSNSFITAGQWYHLAVTRNGNTYRLFINGVLDATVTNSSTINNGNGPLTIGGYSGSNQTDKETVNGYLSGVRIVKGTAVYTSAFTPPTAPVTAIENTSFLCNFTNGGIIDYTGKNNLETVGNAQIDTTTKKYGTGSMYFDGTGDYLVAYPNIDIELGSGDYTIECWVNISGAASSGGIVTKGPVGSLTNTTWSLEFNSTTNFVGFYVHNATSGGYILQSTTNIKSSSWIHLAISRNGNNTKLFVNGIQEGSTYTSGYTISAGDNLYIGGGFYAPTTRSITGYIDDLRITKGVARYTSNFTPPISAHKLR